MRGLVVLLSCVTPDCTPACMLDDLGPRPPDVDEQRLDLGDACYVPMDLEPPYFELPAGVHVPHWEQLLVVDFDRDGLPDVIGHRPSWSLFRGIGDGMFAPPTVLVDEDPDSDDAMISDIDGDGAPDVVSKGESEFAVWLNRDGDSLDPAVYLPIPEEEYDGLWGTADIDADGRDELIVGLDSLEAWMLLPTGELAERRILLAYPFDTVSKIEIDRTPGDELVGLRDDQIVVFDPAEPESTFTTVTNDHSYYFEEDDAPSRLHVADMDADGIDEILAGAEVYGRDADGTWARRVSLTSELAAGLGRVRFGDGNGDGRADLFSVRRPGCEDAESCGGPCHAGALEIWITGGGHGVAEFDERYVAGSDVYITDLDGDGRDDVFSPNGIALARDCD